MRFLVLISILLGTCSGPDLQNIETRSDDGSLFESYHVDLDGLKQSEYKRYTAGILREMSHYQNDTLNGQRIIYDSLGRHIITETYQMGSFAGPYIIYYQDGTIEQEGSYLNNAMEGIWTTYYPNGQIKEEVTMAGNEENGPFKEYHENGALKAVGQYLNGPKEDGKLKIYDKNGDLEREMECTSGICRTVDKEETE